jgi:hypothetical protein
LEVLGISLPWQRLCKEFDISIDTITSELNNSSQRVDGVSHTIVPPTSNSNSNSTHQVNIDIDQCNIVLASKSLGNWKPFVASNLEKCQNASFATNGAIATYLQLVTTFCNNGHVCAMKQRCFVKFNAKFYFHLNRKAIYTIPSLTIHFKMTQT